MSAHGVYLRIVYVLVNSGEFCGTTLQPTLEYILQYGYSLDASAIATTVRQAMQSLRHDAYTAMLGRMASYNCDLAVLASCISIADAGTDALADTLGTLIL